MASNRDDLRKAELKSVQGIWEKTPDGSQAEGRAFQAWLNLCRTDDEFVEIYKATESHCPCKLAIVYHLVANVKSLSRIAKLCDMFSPPK